MKKILITLLAVVLFACTSQHEKQKQELADGFTELCKTMNEQLPANIDDLTVLQSVAFYDWTMTANYRVEFEKSDFTDEEWDEIMSEMKKVLKRNVGHLFKHKDRNFTPKQLSDFYKEIGFKYKAMFCDIHGELVGAIIFYPEDFDVELN